MAPPLPDKKKKVGGASSEQSSPISSPGDVKKVVENFYSESSSKESSPPTSLERILLKPSDEELMNNNIKEEDEAVKSKTSPKSGLSRKSSILKIRAFFEKSPSEPRTDKKSKNVGSSTRKSNSFRLREGPKFYRSLEDDPSSYYDKTQKMENNHRSDFTSPQSLTVIETRPLNDNDYSNEKETSNRYLVPTGSAKKMDDKPSLPVKRSKSMKVYRGFDIRTESSEPEATQRLEMSAVQEAFVPTTCGIILSKTPSVTYISSKDKLHPLGTETLMEQMRNKNLEESQTSNPKEYLPLTTSSLDRGREQRVTKQTPPVSGTPICGSLDRAVVVEHKSTPTYVNVLIRNQVSRYSLFSNTSNSNDASFSNSGIIYGNRKLLILLNSMMTLVRYYTTAKLISCMEMEVN